MIESPPSESSRGEDVLKYLARYLTGGPISDRRILSADEQEVTLLAREGKTAGGDRRQVPITLSSVEFVRRWSLHILPKGYTKTRRYGGWSNRRRDDYLEHWGRLLAASDAFFVIGGDGLRAVPRGVLWRGGVVPSVSALRGRDDSAGGAAP